MEKHGYSNVYRVTDYQHPFDRYAQEPVICFDEFRSSLMVGDMLDYLDGYPRHSPQDMPIGKPAIPRSISYLI